MRIFKAFAYILLGLALMTTAFAGELSSRNTVTRSETAEMFYVLLSDDLPVFVSDFENPFEDIAPNEQHYDAISALYRADFMFGRSENRFEPEEPITRAEFAVLVAKFVGQNGYQECPFSDISEHWAERDICSAWASGCIEGYKDGTFRPDESILQEDAIDILNQMKR